MLRLRRKSDGKEGWPVVDGQPTEPYELPNSEQENEALLREMDKHDARRRELDRTAPTRALRNIVKARQQANGIVVFERVLLGGALLIDQRRWLNGKRQSRCTIWVRSRVLTITLTKRGGERGGVGKPSAGS